VITKTLRKTGLASAGCMLADCVGTLVQELEKLEARELMRPSEVEKNQQIANLAAFHARHAAETPAAVRNLQRVPQQRGN
jgi:hypothetical protein